MSFSVFDIAGSGMTAQRVKMDTISSNIANINTTRNPDGTKGVYVKKDVAFRSVLADSMSRGPSNFSDNATDANFNAETGSFTINTGVALNNGQRMRGVEVAQITAAKDPIKTIYDPSHPDADADGYVQLPNINIVEEMVGMVSASKAYQANATAAENAKTMIQSAMGI